MPTAPAAQRAKPQEDGKAESTLTEYVILQAVKVHEDKFGDELPDGLHVDGDGNVTLWLPLRNEKSEHGKDGEVRIVRSNAPANAIKTATKLDDGSGAQREGTFKSVPLRSWKGGKVYKNAQKVVTAAEDLAE